MYKMCPFCGGNDLLIQQVDCEDREGTPIRIMCGICGGAGPWVYTNTAKFKKWVEDKRICDKEIIEIVCKETGWNGRK